ncbi:MAG: FG-GAP repeat protein, partial [Thermoplasmata archaeon]|nr:FG-GAP repeat protein [Thermoplasmata archaeon]
SVSSAGDVNGDGYDDFLIASHWNNDGGENTGQTYLFFGKPEGWSMHTNISEADASFHGEKVNDAAGYSVAGAGDVNGDGFDDILIGSQRSGDGGDIAGQTYLILGKADGWSMDTSLSDADASFWGENEGDFSGCSVAGAGDFNGDGYDDFLIGASSNDDKESGSGQTYLILGRSKGWSMDIRLSAANASYWGEGKGDNSGRSVAGAGDVNGDGHDDILIGAPDNYDGGEKAGQAYLIFASPKLDPPQISDDPWGWEVAGATIAIGVLIAVVYVLVRWKRTGHQ